MMRMLHAGGVPTLGNHSSFEDDRVQGLPRDWQWLDEAQGKAVKILEPTHYAPPHQFRYQFIWTRRDPLQQAQSQIKFLRQVAGLNVGDKAILNMRDGIRKDTEPYMRRLASYEGSTLLEMHFETVLANPLGSAIQLQNYLQRPFDATKAAAVVIKRDPACKPNLDIELSYLERDDK